MYLSDNNLIIIFCVAGNFKTWNRHKEHPVFSLVGFDPTLICAVEIGVATA